MRLKKQNIQLSLYSQKKFFSIIYISKRLHDIFVYMGKQNKRKNSFRRLKVSYIKFFNNLIILKSIYSISFFYIIARVGHKCGQRAGSQYVSAECFRYSGEGDELISPVYNAPTLPPYRVSSCLFNPYIFRVWSIGLFCQINTAPWLDTETYHMALGLDESAEFCMKFGF